MKTKNENQEWIDCVDYYWRHRTWAGRVLFVPMLVVSIPAVIAYFIFAGLCHLFAYIDYKTRKP